MTEVSSAEASQILGISHDTINRHVKKGLLTARREGVQRRNRIKIEELRRFAEEYQFRFDEELVNQLAKN